MNRTSEPSRREFLAIVAATAALPASSLAGAEGRSIAGTEVPAYGRGSGRAGAPPPSTGPIKLGLASYSLRKFPFDRCLEMAKSLDIKYINFKDVHIPRTDPPEAIRAARAKTEAAGLTILGGGTISMKNDEAAVRKDFEYARLAGMPLIVAAPTHDALDLVERMAKEFDIRIAIHNHGPEDKHFPSPYDVYKAVKARDSHMGLCVDVGHTVRCGVDVTKAVLDLKDRVYDFHAKDLRDLKDKDSQVIVGKGAIDYPALFRALLKIRFTGHVGLEYEVDADNPLPGIQQSFAYMRGVLDAIAT